MKTDIEKILKDSEKELLSELKKDEYLISEHDIQSLHFYILRKALEKYPEYTVSTEWTYYKTTKEKSPIKRFDLVIFNNKSEKEKKKNVYVKKDIYTRNSQKLLYIAEYKVDTAPGLQPKQRNAFNSRYEEILKEFKPNKEYSLRIFCLLIHKTYTKEDKHQEQNELKYISKFDSDCYIKIHQKNYPK
jgi:hypothetical protein